MTGLARAAATHALLASASAFSTPVACGQLSWQHNLARHAPAQLCRGSIEDQILTWMQSDEATEVMHMASDDDGGWSEGDDVVPGEELDHPLVHADAPQHARPLLEVDEGAFIERALQEEAYLGAGSALQECRPDKVSEFVRKHGVARLRGVLSERTAAELHAYVLGELDRKLQGGTSGEPSSEQSGKQSGKQNGRKSGKQSGRKSGKQNFEEGYELVAVGSGTQRVSRHVGAGSAKADDDDDEEERRWDLRLSASNPLVRRALTELIGDGAPLGDALEALGGRDAQLWELAAIVSVPGAAPQIVHADATWTARPLLLTAFVALQPVSREMGPTRFLPRTHADPAHAKIVARGDATGLGGGGSGGRGEGGKRAPAAGRPPPSWVGLLETGDAAFYDGRLLHCGGANRSDRPRALFYLTFRSRRGHRDDGGAKTTPPTTTLAQWR